MKKPDPNRPNTWEVVNGWGRVRCPVCGHEQDPTYIHCINCCTHDEIDIVPDGQGYVYLVCRNCKKMINQEDVTGKYYLKRL